MRLPNFLIIGAPKSGTTSLFYYLGQHPDIYFPARKELHYFSYPYLKESSKGPGDVDTLSNLCKNTEEYEAYYDEVKKESAVGEISPSYLHYYNVADIIKSKLGLVKIVVVLRNPVEKAYSQYMHMVRDQRETMGFYDALLAENERKEKGWGGIWSYSGSSLYADGIEKYHSVFGKDNVKIILFEDMVDNTNTVVSELFSYLDVDSAIKSKTSTIYNRSGNSRSRMVSNFFLKPNGIKKIIKTIIPERIRGSIRLTLLDLNIEKKELMDLKSKKYLIEFFRQDVARLEDILGKKLNWLEK
jgi:hypothetical protein